MHSRTSMPDITPDRWAELYDRAFPQVYRALVAATFDRERALDGLHDAFEAGARPPPPHHPHPQGRLHLGALPQTPPPLVPPRPGNGPGGGAAAGGNAPLL